MTQKEMLETIASLNNEAQNKFYESLRAQGFTEQDIFTIQSMVFYYKMYYNEGFYKAVKDAVCESVTKEILNNGGK